ncbi:unnamed protein product, partial [Ectocarpus sp. 12 AP-2014]
CSRCAWGDVFFTDQGCGPRFVFQELAREMNDHCDINKLLRLEAHLNGTSCGIESPLRRDAKVNLLKFLQTGAVKSFERSYDDMVFELDKTGGLACLRNIVPVPPDGALAQ